MSLPRPQSDDSAAIRQAIALAFDMIEKFEPWRDVGATGQPAFSANWGSFTGNPVSFYKNPLNIVRMKGIAQKSTVAPAQNDVIFTLPPGYRPVQREWFATIGNQAANALGLGVVEANGDVKWFAGAAAAGEILGMAFSFRAL